MTILIDEIIHNNCIEIIRTNIKIQQNKKIIYHFNTAVFVSEMQKQFEPFLVDSTFLDSVKIGFPFAVTSFLVQNRI